MIIFNLLKVSPLDTKEEFVRKTNYPLSDVQRVAKMQALGVYNGRNTNLLSLIQTTIQLNETLVYLDEEEIAPTLIALHQSGALDLLITRPDELLTALQGLDGKKLTLAVNGLRRLHSFEPWATLQTKPTSELSKTDAVKDIAYRSLQGRLPRRQDVESVLTIHPKLARMTEWFFHDSLDIKQINEGLLLGLFLNTTANSIMQVTSIGEKDAMAFTLALGDFNEVDVRDSLLSILRTLSNKQALQSNRLAHYQHQIAKSSDYYQKQLAQVHKPYLAVYYLLFIILLTSATSKNWLHQLQLATALRALYFVYFSGSPPFKRLPIETTYTKEEQLNAFIDLLVCLPTQFLELINISLQLGIEDVTLTDHVKNELIKFTYDLHPDVNQTFLTQFSFKEERAAKRDARAERANTQLFLRQQAILNIRSILLEEKVRMEKIPGHEIKVQYINKLICFIDEDVSNRLWTNAEHLKTLIDVISLVFDKQTTIFGRIVQRVGADHFFKPTTSRSNLNRAIDECKQSINYSPKHLPDRSKTLLDQLNESEDARSWLGLSAMEDISFETKADFLEAEGIRREEPTSPVSDQGPHDSRDESDSTGSDKPPSDLILNLSEAFSRSEFMGESESQMTIR